MSSARTSTSRDTSAGLRPASISRPMPRKTVWWTQRPDRPSDRAAGTRRRSPRAGPSPGCRDLLPGAPRPGARRRGLVEDAQEAVAALHRAEPGQTASTSPRGSRRTAPAADSPASRPRTRRGEPVGHAGRVAGACLARAFRTSTGPVDAVRGIDLTVREDEILGFLGPDGTGGTTTLRMLTPWRRRPAPTGAPSPPGHPDERARAAPRRLARRPPSRTPSSPSPAAGPPPPTPPP